MGKKGENENVSFHHLFDILETYFIHINYAIDLYNGILYGIERDRSVIVRKW